MNNGEKKFPVMEIFGPTIQGEGLMVGRKTHFIRFGYCDSKCTSCDSMHSVIPDIVKKNARWLTVGEIAKELEALMIESDCHTVTFSGGNPAIHDLTDLVTLLQNIKALDKLLIAVETQGTLYPAWLLLCNVITVSPKSPGMGEIFDPIKYDRFYALFKNHPGFNCKIVIFDQVDIEFAKQLWKEFPCNNKYLSLGNPTFPTYNVEGSQNPLNIDIVDHGDSDLCDDDYIKLSLLKSYEVLCEDVLQEKEFDDVIFLPQLHVLTWANKQEV